jgi:hypothetical protein
MILAVASHRFDGNVLPLPGSLRGGAQPIEQGSC